MLIICPNTRSREFIVVRGRSICPCKISLSFTQQVQLKTKKKKSMPKPRKFLFCEWFGPRSAPYRSKHALTFIFFYALLCGILSSFNFLYAPEPGGRFIGEKDHTLDKVPLEIANACRNIDPCISTHIFAYRRILQSDFFKLWQLLIILHIQALYR